MRITVIDAFEHDVFEGDKVTRRTIEITYASSHQLTQRVLLVDRHQTVTQRVIGRMQRYGQRNRTFVAQAVHCGHDA